MPWLSAPIQVGIIGVLWVCRWFFLHTLSAAIIWVLCRCAQFFRSCSCTLVGVIGLLWVHLHFHCFHVCTSFLVYTFISSVSMCVHYCFFCFHVCTPLFLLFPCVYTVISFVSICVHHCFFCFHVCSLYMSVSVVFLSYTVISLYNKTAMQTEITGYFWQACTDYDWNALHKITLTPSLPQPVQFLGWMMHGRACKRSIFRSCNIYFQCYAFG